MSRMNLTLLFAALFVAALAFAGVRAFAVEGPSQPGLSGVPYPGEQSLTKDFLIGLKGPDQYCDVLEIAAPTLDDALIYARDYCPACNRQDLTGEHVRAEAPWESMTPRAEVFCMAR